MQITRSTVQLIAYVGTFVAATPKRSAENNRMIIAEAMRPATIPNAASDSPREITLPDPVTRIARSRPTGGTAAARRLSWCRCPRPCRRTPLPGLRAELRAELPEMMIDMPVPQRAPLPRVQAAECRMGRPRAFSVFPAEPVDQRVQLRHVGRPR